MESLISGDVLKPISDLGIALLEKQKKQLDGFFLLQQLKKKDIKI